MFTIDGNTYDGVLSLKRTFTVDEDNNGGKTLDGTVLRSVIGTRYDYELTLDADGMTKTQYDTLYEALTAPQVSHSVTMPYGKSGTKTFTAYIKSGTDELERIDSDGRVWGSLSVSFYTVSPQRVTA